MEMDDYYSKIISTRAQGKVEPKIRDSQVIFVVVIAGLVVLCVATTICVIFVFISLRRDKSKERWGTSGGRGRGRRGFFGGGGSFRRSRDLSDSTGGILAQTSKSWKSRRGQPEPPDIFPEKEAESIKRRIQERRLEKAQKEKSFVNLEELPAQSGDSARSLTESSGGDFKTAAQTFGKTSNVWGGVKSGSSSPATNQKSSYRRKLTNQKSQANQKMTPPNAPAGAAANQRSPTFSRQAAPANQQSPTLSRRAAAANQRSPTLSRQAAPANQQSPTPSRRAAAAANQQSPMLNREAAATNQNKGPVSPSNQYRGSKSPLGRSGRRRKTNPGGGVGGGGGDEQRKL